MVLFYFVLTPGSCHSHETFPYLLLLIWSAFDLNLVMISSLVHKCFLVKKEVNLSHIFCLMKSSDIVQFKPIPVMKTGFSLWNISHREKPVFTTGNPVLIAGIPVMKTGFSLWEFPHCSVFILFFYLFLWKKWCITLLLNSSYSQ